MIVESNTDEQWKKNRQMTQAGSRICRGTEDDSRCNLTANVHLSAEISCDIWTLHIIVLSGMIE